MGNTVYKMVPEQTEMMSSFIKKILENHTTADVQNASNETIGRDLKPDELVAFVLYMEQDSKYKWLNVGGLHFIRINPNYETELLQKEKLVFDVKNAKRVYDTYWITFGLAVAAFIISVILLVLKLTTKSGQ